MLSSFEGHSGRVIACAFNADASLLATASDDRTARIWNVATSTCVHVLSGHEMRVNSCTFSPDGVALNHFLVLGLLIIINIVCWDPESLREPWALRPLLDALRSSLFAGAQLATASFDASLRLWDVASGECTAMLEGHETAVNAVCYSPDGALLSTCSDDNSVAVWDAASGEILASMAGHWARVVNCAFSPDGSRIASASYDNTVKVWLVR